MCASLALVSGVRVCVLGAGFGAKSISFTILGLRSKVCFFHWLWFLGQGAGVCAQGLVDFFGWPFTLQTWVTYSFGHERFPDILAQ